MRYTYLRVKNFKGIRDLQIDFVSHPANSISTLVGLNESGKTTILEALSYFTYGKDQVDPVSVTGYERPKYHELIPISKRSNFTDSIQIELGVELDTNDNLAIAEVIRKKSTSDVRQIKKVDLITITQTLNFKNSKYDSASNTWGYFINMTVGSQRNYRSIGKSEIWDAAVEHMRERMPRILYFPHFLFDFPQRIFLEPSPGGELSATEKFYLAVVQDILESLNNGTNIEQHLLARSKTSRPEDIASLNALLLEMGRDVTANVFRQWNSIFGRSITDKAIRLSIEEYEGRKSLRFGIEDTDGEFEISERSLGFRWFFVFLLLTHYRVFRKTSETSLMFLLDEPASNLHSTAQVKLLESFDRLSKRCHLVYTTHSHHLINPAWLENTFVIRNTGIDYSTESDPFDFTLRKTNIEAQKYRIFASLHPEQSTYFQPVLDALEYRPSELEHVPSVVMLEGKYDFYTLHLAQRVLTSSDALSLLPGTGAGKLDTIIRLYIGWGREFVVLLDADDEGEAQKERYTDMFGAALNGKIFTLRDAAAEWKRKRLEDLFTEKDRLNIQLSEYPEDTCYSKKHFNKAIQSAYISREKMNFEDETKRQFLKLLCFLRDKLTADLTEL